MKNNGYIDNMILELQEMYRQEFGEDISAEEIDAIVNSQFALVPIAMRKGEAVEIVGLGKFTTHEAKRAGREANKAQKIHRADKEALTIQDKPVFEFGSKLVS